MMLIWLDQNRRPREGWIDQDPCFPAQQGGQLVPTDDRRPLARTLLPKSVLHLGAC